LNFSADVLADRENKSVSEAVGTIDKKEKEGIGEFVKETRAELDKTTFPSSDEVQKTTIIVIISVVFFAVYLFLIDHMWVYLLEGINWLVGKLFGI
jgi:preprotein translocase subunit SecE